MKFLQAAMPLLCIFVLGACDKDSGVSAPPAPLAASPSGNNICSAQQKADLRSLELTCQQANNDNACQNAAAAFKTKYASSMDCLTSPPANNSSGGSSANTADYPSCPQQVVADVQTEEQACDSSGDPDSTVCQAANKTFNTKYPDLMCQGQIGDMHFSICNSTQGECPDQD